MKRNTYSCVTASPASPIAPKSSPKSRVHYLQKSFSEFHFRIPFRLYPFAFRLPDVHREVRHPCVTRVTSLWHKDLQRKTRKIAWKFMRSRPYSGSLLLQISPTCREKIHRLHCHFFLHHCLLLPFSPFPLFPRRRQPPFTFRLFLVQPETRNQKPRALRGPLSSCSFPLPPRGAPQTKGELSTASQPLLK